MFSWVDGTGILQSYPAELQELQTEIEALQSIKELQGNKEPLL